MRKRGLPDKWELVVCRVKEIKTNSVICELVEYENKEALIHVSEVASRWVKNIREFLKEKQYIVAKVLKIENNGKIIMVSKRRVGKDEEKRVMSEFKKELKAEKMLEFAAKKLNKTLDEAYNEVGYKLIEEIGSLFKAFEYGIRNKEFLEKVVGKKWTEVIADVARSKFSKKKYEIKAEIELYFYSSDGVRKLREVLKNIKSAGYSVSYISAPKYIVIGSGNNYKELENRFEEFLEDVKKKVKKLNGFYSFKILD